MLTAALITYAILCLLFGYKWPIEFLLGKAETLGRIIVIPWLILFIVGLITEL